MKIAVLGTGMVGRTLAARLACLGHHVVVGTRDVASTLARTEADQMGTPPFRIWNAEHSAISLVDLNSAAAHGELIINAIAGISALAALTTIDDTLISDKILLDLSLPLDLSHGLPPRLTISGDDSLGEQIQRALPNALVVKALNTVFCQVMVAPERVPGQHTLFVAGEDEAAKKTVAGILQQFGWQPDSVLDLGGIAASRSVEMYMQLYFNLHEVLGTFDFNIAVVRAEGGN